MDTLNTTVIQHLARCAALPLRADRQQAAAQVLAAWLPDANALSEKMRAAKYQALTPATVFIQPEWFVDEA